MMILCFILTTKTPLPEYIAALISAILLFIPNLFERVFVWSSPKEACTLLLPAKLLDTAQTNHVDSDPGWDTLYRFAYEYEGKSYSKTLLLHSFQGDPKVPFSVYICPDRPKMCYIALEDESGYDFKESLRKYKSNIKKTRK
ncbi:MAG: hypothetical protein PUB39_01810 [Eubacteriales bacterium]|nr:hypothetical protein [Eubacteriales bacterium]